MLSLEHGLEAHFTVLDGCRAGKVLQVQKRKFYFLKWYRSSVCAQEDGENTGIL